MLPSLLDRTLRLRRPASMSRSVQTGVLVLFLTYPLIAFGQLPCGGDICGAVNKGIQGAQKAGGDLVETVKDAAGNTVKTITKAGGDIESTLIKANGDTITTLKKAGSDTTETIEKAGADTTTTITKASGDFVRTIQKAGSDSVTTIQKAGGDTITTVAKAGVDVARTIEKANGDTVNFVRDSAGATVETFRTASGDFIRTVQKAGDDTITTITKARNDVIVTVEKAGSDTVTTVEKGWKDTTAEGQRAVANGVQAGDALVRFSERQVKGAGGALNNAATRVREGKIVDALWGLGTEPLQYTEANSASAVQESVVLNTVAQVAATAYGGPAGAAAYAAWYTYRATGNAELAFRAGVLTGATSYAFGAVGKMPSGTAGQLARKVVVGGAIGGLSVAAAGGDKEAIKTAFLLSGGMVLIQDQYEKVLKHPLDARASNHDAYCMAAVPGTAPECTPPDIAYERDANGKIRFETDANGVPDQTKPLIDVRKTDPRFNHVGLWSSANDNSLAGERGDFMTGVSKIPGTNAMALFHDHWAVAWHMGMTETVTTIVPATVITYIGTGAPFYLRVQTAFTDQAKQHPPEVQPDKNLRICHIENVTRTISTLKSDDHDGCHVIYRKETGLSTPWNARHDKQYCEKIQNVLIHNLTSNGWTCTDSR